MPNSNDTTPSQDQSRRFDAWCGARGGGKDALRSLDSTKLGFVDGLGGKSAGLVEMAFTGATGAVSLPAFSTSAEACNTATSRGNVLTPVAWSTATGTAMSLVANTDIPSTCSKFEPELAGASTAGGRAISTNGMAPEAAHVESAGAVKVRIPNKSLSSAID